MNVLVLGRQQDCLDYVGYCDRVGTKLAFFEPPPLDLGDAASWPSTMATAVEAVADAFGRADDVISFHDGYQLQADVLKRLGGLPSRPLAALATLTDKSRFKAHAAVHPHVVRHVEIPADGATGAPAARALVEANLSFPVVLKPSNGFYSAGVVRVDDPVSFPAAYGQTRRVCRVLRQQRGTSGVLVEEYLEGEEYAVDGFVVGGGVTPSLFHRKRPRLEGPYFHETAYVTERFDAAKGEAFLAMLTSILGGVGLDDSPFHAEFRFDAAGRLHMLEIAPRLSGGGATAQHLLRIVTGIDGYGSCHRLGREHVDLTPSTCRVGVEYDAAAPTSGFLKHVDRAVAACAARGADPVLQHRRDGDFVFAPPLNVETVLTAFFGCDSRAEADALFDDIEQHCRIETDVERP